MSFENLVQPGTTRLCSIPISLLILAWRKEEEVEDEGEARKGKKKEREEIPRNDGTAPAGSGGGDEKIKRTETETKSLSGSSITPNTAQGGGVPDTPASRRILSQGCDAYSKTCFSRLQSRLILILHLSELVRPLRWNQITLKRAQKESAENH